MPFYVNIRGEKLQASARNVGFDGKDWRERILTDLLHDGQLEIDTNGDAFNLYGRIYRAMAALDKFRADTLFLFALFSGPARGNRVPPGTVKIPGPWLVAPEWATPGPCGLAVSAHLRTFLDTPQDLRPPTTTGFGTLAEALRKSHRTSGSDTPALALAKAVSAVNGQTDGLAIVAQTSPVDLPMARINLHQAGDALALHEQSSAPLSCPAEDSSAAEPFDASYEAPPSGDKPSGLGRADLLRRLPMTVREFVGAVEPEAALKSTREALIEEVRLVQERLASLPSTDQLGETIRRLDRAAGLANDLGIALTAAAPSLANPPEVDRTLTILEAMASPQWNRLPDWLAPRGVKRDALLADDAASAEVEEALGWVSSKFAGDLPEALASLHSSDGERLVERLRAAWQLHEARNHLGELLRPLLPHEILKGMAAAHLQAVIARVDDLRARLNPGALEQIWDAMPTFGVDGWLDATDPDRFATLPGLVVRSIADWSAVDALLLYESSRRSIGMQPSVPPALIASEKSIPNLQGFDHPMTDDRGHVRSGLVAVILPAPDREVGTFNIAIRIKARSPILGSALLYVRTQHLRARVEIQYGHPLIV